VVFSSPETIVVSEQIGSTAQTEAPFSSFTSVSSASGMSILGNYLSALLAMLYFLLEVSGMSILGNYLSALLAMLYFLLEVS
jgi:hypothetical protein